MTDSKMFWGLVIESGQSYTQNVGRSFSIRMAVLEELGDKPSDEPVRVYAKYEKMEYILCMLCSKNNMVQIPLNVKFETGSQLTLRAAGGSSTSRIHLTGYCVGQSSSDTWTTSHDSAIKIPFAGLQQSILVSRKKGGEEPDKDKIKKRVSIEESDDIIITTQNSKGAGEGPSANGNLSDDDEEGEEEETDDSSNDYDILWDVPSSQKRLQHSSDATTEESGDFDESKMTDDEDDDDDDDEEEEDDDELDEDLVKLSQNFSERKYATSTPKPTKLNSQSSPSSSGIKTPDVSSANRKLVSTSSAGNTPMKQKEVLKTPDVTPAKRKTGSISSAGNTPMKPKDGLKTPDNSNRLLDAPSSAGRTPMKYVSKGGLMIQEMKVGTGPIAKSGKMVTVNYEGHLKSNNKLFDSDKSGFKFRLGKGEVIKGWDVGVEGMKVGGKRKLIIPANLGYGKRGMPPDIPPQSTLVFDVELRHVS